MPVRRWSRLFVAALALAFVVMAVIALTGERNELMRVASASHVAAQPPCGSDVTPRPGVVVTDRGAVVGVADGETYAYKDIPYAAPPVGVLRWRPPVAPDCWRGERPATAFGNVCPQFDDSGAVVGDEDCLTLNIWTPSAPAGDTSWPVMFFIHGGGNVQGSSAQPIYDGRYLAERAGAVVVTFNYRLGALGFLAHPALDAESAQGVSGNYGILDQIAALSWVQRNIPAFGGDPRRLLLFGESAGGLDVCVLVASPLARGLFASALIESGGCTQPPLATAERAGQETVAAAGCADADGVAACLRGKSAAEIVGARPISISVATLAGRAFTPNVDGYVLTGSPLQVIARGEHNHVPLIIGTNADETAGLRPPPIADEAAYRAALAQIVGPRVADTIVAQYPPATYGSARAAFIAATSDAFFTCPARGVARAAVAGQQEPVYRYFFTHALDAGAARSLGAFHGLELAFVFHTLGASGAYTPSDAELALSDAMIGYWARLAATGNPNGAGAVPWPAYDAAMDTYLRLDTPVSAGTGVRTAGCDFWARIAGEGTGGTGE